MAARYALGRVLRGDLHTPMERVVGIEREREKERHHREKREGTRRTREKKEKKKKRKKKVRLSLNIYLIIRSGDLEGSRMARGCETASGRERERESEREERIEKAA